MSLASLATQTHMFLDYDVSTLTGASIIRNVRTMNAHIKDGTVQVRALISIRDIASTDTLAQWLIGLGVGKYL